MYFVNEKYVALIDNVLKLWKKGFRINKKRFQDFFYITLILYVINAHKIFT